MQEFFMDYGLWLLIGLLVVIALVFLLSGRRKDDGVPDGAVSPPPLDEPAPELDRVAAVAAVPLASEPAVAPPLSADPAVAPAPVLQESGSDDLLKLKGVGPKLGALLTDLGITRYAQIAAWSDADIAAVDAKLGHFKGRPVRDQWVDQAGYLAAGDITGFEAKYGKL